MDEYQDDKKGPEYPDCLGCFHNHDTAEGICNVSGPCQAHPNAENLKESAPVELLPPAVMADNESLFDNAA